MIDNYGCYSNRNESISKQTMKYTSKKSSGHFKNLFKDEPDVEVREHFNCIAADPTLNIEEEERRLSMIYTKIEVNDHNIYRTITLDWLLFINYALQMILDMNYSEYLALTGSPILLK